MILYATFGFFYREFRKFWQNLSLGRTLQGYSFLIWLTVLVFALNSTIVLLTIESKNEIWKEIWDSSYIEKEINKIKQLNKLNLAQR